MAVYGQNAAIVALYAAASRVATVVLILLSSVFLPTHDASGVHKFFPGTFPVPGRPGSGGVLGAFTRWDAAWFLSIADSGYPTEHGIHDVDELLVECSGTKRAWGGEGYAREMKGSDISEHLTLRCRDDVPLVEQAHAFFPLYPWIVRWAAVALRKGLLTTGFILREADILVLAAVAVSNACFVAAAVLLYHLGIVVMGDSLLAFRGALAFCATPAGVFFSTAYSESAFAALTFAGLLVLFTESRRRKSRWEEGDRSALNGFVLEWIAATLLSLATLTRSNGITAVAVFVLEKLRWMANEAGLFSNTERGAKLSEVVPLRATRSSSSGRCTQSDGSGGGGGDNAVTPESQLVMVPWPRLVACAISTLFQALLVVAPYALVQVHAYHKFCGGGGLFEGHAGPEVDNDASIHPWCSWRVPSLYAYVQSTYWGVGALKYYRWKQIPNFLLAAPVLFLTATGITSFFSAQLQPSSPSSAGAADDGRLSSSDTTARRWPRCPIWLEYLVEAFFGIPGLRHAASSPFERTGAAALVLQWAFLGLFAAVCMNVQVATRFLASACPPLHWWTACLLFPQGKTGARAVTGSGMTAVGLRWYMGLYVMVGALLHANFLPWT